MKEEGAITIFVGCSIVGVSSFFELQLIGYLKLYRDGKRQEKLTVDICPWGEARILRKSVCDVCISSVWILICLVRFVMFLVRGD
jgi:hypothetical protein